MCNKMSRYCNARFSHVPNNHIAIMMKVKSFSVFMFHVISRFYARHTLKPICFDGDHFEHLAFCLSALASKLIRRPAKSMLVDLWSSSVKECNSIERAQSKDTLNIYFVFIDIIRKSIPIPNQSRHFHCRLQ